MNITLLYNPPTLPIDHRDYASEAGVLESVEAMEVALAAAGHRVRRLPLGESFLTAAAALAADRPDVVLNLCEGFAGSSRGEPYVAGMLEMLDLAYTGCGPECLSLVRDKRRAKLLFQGAGLPTAEFFYVARGGDLPHAALQDALRQGPLLVKPACEDASLGISSASVVTDYTALVEQVRAVADTYGDVLVERYIAGREFNVGVIALGELRALPVAEIDFQTNGSMRWPIVTYDSKWSAETADYRGTPVRCPADIPEELERKITEIALAAFQVTGCRDYARVDLRVTAAGEVFILEVNANPDAGPTAGLARALRTAGISYEAFLEELVRAAALRSGRSPNLSASTAAQQLSTVQVRPYRSDDRSELLDILRACEMFRPDEIEIAAEIIDERDKVGPDGHYKLLVAEADGRTVGWSCHGRIPMTDATYDLYWIAVRPDVQARGVGKSLLQTIEQQLHGAGARWLIAETSSTPIYDKTRAFYLRTGFTIASDLADFYRPGDGRTTFVKRLDGT